MTMTYQTLLSSLESLIEDVERETALVRAGKSDELPRISEVKRRSAEQYEAHARWLADGGKSLGAPSQLVRRKLELLTKTLDTALADNTRAVAAAREASTRLIGRIIEAAGQRSAAGSYGESGNLVIDSNRLTSMRQRV